MSDDDDGFKPCSHRFTQNIGGRVECMGCGGSWTNANPKCAKTGVHALNQRTWLCDECGFDVEELQERNGEPLS